MRWLTHLFTRDLGLKAVSLLLGTGICYGTHRLVLDRVRFGAVPVEVQRPGDRDWAITLSPAVVSLKLTGPQHVIDRIRYVHPSVVIPIGRESVPDGTERSIPIEAKHLSIPVRGVTVESDPPEVKLSIDEIAEETFDLVPDVAPPSAGFKIERILATPSKVVVRGPKSFLQAARAKGATLRTSRVDPGYQGERNYSVPNVELVTTLLDRRVECRPKAVTLLISVSQEYEYRRMEKIPVLLLLNPRDPARKVDLPAEISIAMKGPQVVRFPGGQEKAFRELTPSDVRAYVALPPDTQPGIHPEVGVILELPPGVLLDGPTPTVRVVVEAK